MTDLPHVLTRSLIIRAPRELVFRYFTDSARFAVWWGEGSHIQGKVGGEVFIQYPNDIQAQGTVTAIDEPNSIAFFYGYKNGHPELPPGQSQVRIRLHDHPDGTLLEFHHAFATEELRDQHIPGWRYHLAVFANVTANEHHLGAGAVIDRWFDAWAEADPDRRHELLQSCATEDVSMRDPFSCLVGRDELHGHIANTHVHLPGIVMRRQGEPKHCQGTLLVEWSAAGPDGATVMRGINVVQFAADGRIRSVTGLAG